MAVFGMGKAAQVQPNEVRGSGVFVAKIRSDYNDSMALLRQNGLRPLAFREALVKIDQDPELKERLKGKWFYLEGKGTELSGYYTFDEKGELFRGKGEIERTVYICDGPQPLSLVVLNGSYVRYDERRFGLDAYSGPDNIATAVVGIRIEKEAVALQDADAPEAGKLSALRRHD